MQPILDQFRPPRTNSAYAQGPASGVDYFSDTGRQQGVANVNPGQSSLTADAEAPGAGVTYVSPETGFAPMTAGRGGRNLGIDSAGREGGISPGTLGMVGYGLNALGQVTGSRDMSMAGSMLGATGAAAQGDFGPMGGFMGGMIGGPTGAALGGAAGMALSGTGTPSRYGAVAGGALGGMPGAALGQLAGMGLEGRLTPKAVAEAALGVATPAYGIANAFTGGRLGNAMFGTDAGLTATRTAPAQPGFFGSLGLQNIGPTIGFDGRPTAGTQVGQVNAPAGYSISSTTSPTGLSGALGQVVSMPTGFNVTTTPGFNVNSVLGPAPSTAGGGGGGGSFGFGGVSASSTGNLGFGGGSLGGFATTGGGGVSSGGGRSSGRGPGGSPNAGGLGGFGGWADGGMIGQDQPGLTQRYMAGGQVQGGQQPMLAMGFADGGAVQMGATPSNASVTQQVNEILRNPQMKQRITAHAQQLMASGELTPQEVQVMAQVAEAAMYNPSLYPQLRQFVAEQGMSPLPPAYDPSVIVKIMAMARALQEMQPMTPPGEVPPTDQAQVQPPVPGMARGGMIKGPGTGRSDSIGTVNETTGEPVRVANNEYIIPEHVVRAKGREFFDNLLRRYADVPKEQA